MLAKDFILITVSGQDRPGITAALMRVITASGQKISDMGQAVTHGLLSLSILIELDPEKKNELGVLKELLFETKKLGMNLDYQIMDKPQIPGQILGEKFILNCVSVKELTSHFLQETAELMAKYSINILRIDTVSPANFRALEMTTLVPPGAPWPEIKKALLVISMRHKIDVAFLKDNVFRRTKRLVIFDMDSTLIDTEVIDEMAISHGVGDSVKKITEQAMNGDIDFDQSLKLRVEKLKGLPVAKMQSILDQLLLTPGTDDFIKAIKSVGLKTALISGGFTFFAMALKSKLGLDYAFANELEIENGQLTGKIIGNIINANQKAFLLNFLAQQENINTEQVVAIGDGANDIPMLSAAGLGIAFHAKELVREKANVHMGHGPMTSILYFLGIPEGNSLFNQS